MQGTTSAQSHQVRGQHDVGMIEQRVMVRRFGFEDVQTYAAEPALRSRADLVSGDGERLPLKAAVFDGALVSFGIRNIGRADLAGARAGDHRAVAALRARLFSRRRIGIVDRTDARSDPRHLGLHHHAGGDAGRSRAAA